MYFDKEVVMWFLEFYLNRIVFLWKGIGVIWLVIFNRFLDRYNFVDILCIYIFVCRGLKWKIVFIFNCGYFLGIVMCFRNEIFFIIVCFYIGRFKIGYEKVKLYICRYLFFLIFDLCSF